MSSELTFPLLVLNESSASLVLRYHLASLFPRFPVDFRLLPRFLAPNKPPFSSRRILANFLFRETSWLGIRFDSAFFIGFPLTLSNDSRDGLSLNSFSASPSTSFPCSFLFPFEIKILKIKVEASRWDALLSGQAGRNKDDARDVLLGKKAISIVVNLAGCN